MKRLLLSVLAMLIVIPLAVQAQDKEENKSPFNVGTFSGLKFRAIGPALMSGRIADIAIDPTEQSTWYIAVGSGNVWKTENAGTTWSPIFDSYNSYSVGCITIDPNNPNVLWLGTGENVSGRHVGYGDGVYRSLNGGRTWENMGLKKSEHIAKILVDPRNSNVVYVAAEGPLWSSGGERGFYKSSDGGKTWNLSLEISEDTGVTDAEFDPGNPDVIYAAAYQRRRSVAAFLAGGPESGIYKSNDAGENWRELSVGLPRGDMGKIGLAVSPQQPNVVYATIEASDREQGFYRSSDYGESWEKKNSYTSGGTGPHYYQEIYADPHQFDRVYQMDVRMSVTDDGGKTFNRVGEEWKHSDNHALAFDPGDPNYLMAGCDGGLYESWDRGKNWKFITNLPVTQFYKMALDNDLPYYNVVGGTQDNNTQYGPTRTNNVHGIRNSDWVITVGGDGYSCAIDPEDPNTIYSEWQRGSMVRYDRRTGEQVDIKPQPEPGDAPERWNWDAPILISPHSHTRLYFGSQRLWRSDDRGDSWRPVSPDLSRNLKRYEQKLIGRTWGADALYDHGAMSWFSNLTNISESPLQEGLIYVGSDDGLIQVTEDGGENWRKIEKIGNAPDLSFINDVKASLHDVDTVFSALDNHKTGDYKPYILKSTDKGRSWTSISGDLPDRHIVWSIAQDHVNKDLLFIGTEYGIFFTIDGGKKWLKLSGGIPTIPFRDIAIQRRENDLVGASFGRGFFVLDDYTPLRTATPELLDQEAVLFPVKTASMFIPASPLGGREKASQGGAYFTAPNPPFGATFTYYLKDSLKTRSSMRQEAEKKLKKEGADIAFPSWEDLKLEEREENPAVIITISDEDGNVIRRLTGSTSSGIHRVTWDLRYPSTTPTDIRPAGSRPFWMRSLAGPMVAPGSYSVSIAKRVDSELTPLAESQTFETVPVGVVQLSGQEKADTIAFQKKTADMQRALMGTNAAAEDANNRLQYIKQALHDTPGADPALSETARDLEIRLMDLREKLTGNRTIARRSEPTAPSIMNRLQTIISGHWNTTSAPNRTQLRNYEIAAEEFEAVLEELRPLIEVELKELESALEEAGAPWTPGRALPRWKR